uniref:Gamma-aminobutyric acid receptor-associated protein-like 2 n=1 Tax=Molossus molossus TaxID=27622 RepID=A0A7J8C7I2_MOLMO|nr:hypothetical protein HJG59_005416 [Molossus molossus]
MKWMFKEDHSLGKRPDIGRAVGPARLVGPLPHSGRPGLGRAERLPLLGFASPRPRSPDRLPTDSVPPSGGPPRSQETEDRGRRDARTRAGACVGRGGGGLGPREPAHRQERQSVWCVSPTEHRCVESAKIRAKYPDRVPVIVEKVSGSQIVDIDKRKYLVPSDITVAQFMWIIRKRIQLPSEKAIFLFVDKTVPQSSLTMGQLYEKEKDEDGFLYVAYSGENTFGF